MEKNIIQDKIRGSLIGGAIGDALGYPIEFLLTNEKILEKYGPEGITRFDTSHWWKKEGDPSANISIGKAWISDDTQMTLYTAMAMLDSKGAGYQRFHKICEAYIEWYFTQMGQNKRGFHLYWISDLPELRTHRAAGHTCTGSLKQIYNGEEPMNDSKGCGGIMRIAPIPMTYVQQEDADIKAIAKLAGESAYITHHHPLAYIPCAMDASIIFRLIQDEAPTRESFRKYIDESISIARELYPNDIEHIERIEMLLDKAITLCDSPFSDMDCILNIGEGWVGDEAFAMAIYAVYKYFDNFEKAIIAAVNHKGDSDSVGAIAGNIIGCICGYDAIPQHFKDTLELHDVILHVADDLWRGQTTMFKQ